MENSNEKKEHKSKIRNVIFIISGIFLIFLIGFTLTIEAISLSFKLNGEELIEISYTDIYEEMGVNFSFFGKDLSKNVEIKSNVNSGEIGEYEIGYSYNIAFVSITRTRHVKIKDMVNPIIELKGEEVTTICPNQEYEEEGYSAYDEIDGDITDKVEVIKGISEVKYKVVDSNGNSVTIAREIKKEDKKGAEITLVGDSTIYIEKGSTYKEPGYKAIDGCDGDLTEKVEIEGKVDTSKLQTFTLTYKIKDSLGNESKVERKVVVKEKKDIEASLPGVIYLTFDDGPSASGSTSKILDILKKNNVKATFFVTGSGPDSLIKRAYNEGHAIGLHTYTHKYEDVYKSIDNYFNDLTKIQKRVENLTGEKITIIRFPGGSVNSVSNNYSNGIMEKLRKEVVNRGYSYFDWNVDGSDAYKCAKSSVKDKKTCVYNNVVSGLSKKRANIVLLHDIKSYTADALQSIIDYGKKNGYTFEVLTSKTSPVRFK